MRELQRSERNKSQREVAVDGVMEASATVATALQLKKTLAYEVKS